MKRGHFALILVALTFAFAFLLYRQPPAPRHHAPPSSTVTRSGVHLIPPASVTDTTVDRYPLAPHDVGVCQVVGPVYRDSLRPAHLTYTDVVAKPLTAETRSAAAGVTLFFAGYRGNPGPFGPAIAYAMARYVGPTDHLSVPPSTDPKVLASARQLDRFLRAGGCPR